MSTESAGIAVILGSVRNERFGKQVTTWVHKQLAEAGHQVDLIDLAELTFPSNMDPHPDVASFTERIDRVDAVLVVTPEYNHSVPGPLKVAIDAVRNEWQAKPIGFVSYGGMSGGLRAVEALRLIFAELHAVTVRDTVSLHNPWGPAADPTVSYPGQAESEALRTMMQQLLWWANALRAAKLKEPYPT
ncbi:NADPH-dependent FMN reductase [Amycolatopsis sp. H20-H5]|uniref:NADPH-dependent FMN reductase n=1 Tax=Amycolatopsis sp. H20-H5 TaxID=3046309 RepID=UPI002DB8D3E9|nr:NAD(P)H-dependent oxidoreductase [Amycolatopsis sp. H20-H5]MEC3975563.1 NAD(P)H-dependent oxidoreductase [Amycolatopsis sp. H20-H5]